MAEDDPIIVQEEEISAIHFLDGVAVALKLWRQQAASTMSGTRSMPDYVVRSLNGTPEELPCLVQLEDEYAAIYFNIVHGSRLRRHFTTLKLGDPCADYRLVARQYDESGGAAEREIELFELGARSISAPAP